MSLFISTNPLFFSLSDDSKNELNSNSINGFKDLTNSEDFNSNPSTTKANTSLTTNQTSDSSDMTASKSVIPISLSGYLKGAIATPLVAIARNNQNILNNSLKNRKTAFEDKKLNRMDSNTVMNNDIRLNSIDDNSIHKNTKGLCHSITLSVNPILSGIID